MKIVERISKCCVALLCLWQASNAAAAEIAEPSAVSAGQASQDPELAIKQFRVAPGMKVELFASEPYLANPVAFTIDERGRFYVAETYRHSAVGAAFRKYEGVLDIRSHMDWLDDDLSARNVQDRVDFLTRRLGPDVRKLAVESERLRLIEDQNGDGKADKSTVFAEGFNNIPDGIAAGVLARDDEVWFACIPDLWLLGDTNKDGRADSRKSLHTGYGVHIGFLGHDLHGLIMGFDGRLYFSIGDRGINVTNKEGKVLFYPDEGAVLRCEPDGSHLEVFSRGLRNPQELAFDQYGNLFTGDNNSDGGDRARWVHLVEGGDSGWRIGYQHLNAPPRRGPWNAERLWHPQWEGQAAYIIPPIANLGYGPSGVAYYPGTGLADRYQGHFFLCDFRGGASSGIHTFTLKPKGASFELAAYEQFIWEVLPTDVEFGIQGGLYFSDWVQGWNKTGKGRIYRVSDPNVTRSVAVVETAQLLTQGMKVRSEQELVKLLSHADMRVRREAQFQLTSRAIEAPNSAAFKSLLETARSSGLELARIHAIWGLGQVARRGSGSADALKVLLKDESAHIRAQTAKILGESRTRSSADALILALADADAQVQFQAAVSLGKLRYSKALPALHKMVEANGDKDLVLRHGGVFALAEIGEVRALADAATNQSSSVRLASALALRRLENSEIARFLNDEEPAIVLEAARAINDVPISKAIPALASLINRAPQLLGQIVEKRGAAPAGRENKVQKVISSVVPETGTTSPAEQLFQRSINANFRLGTHEAAKALVQFATLEFVPETLRAEALNALSDWAKPSGRDRVTGLWHPLEMRDSAAVIKALQPFLSKLLASAPETVRVAAISAVQKLGLVEAEPQLFEAANLASNSNSIRSGAMKALSHFKSKRLPEAIEMVLRSSNESLKVDAWRLQAESKPDETVGQLSNRLASGSIQDRQNAFAILAGIQHPAADALIALWMDKLLSGNVDKEIELDLLDAAGKRTSPTVLTKVKQYEEARPKDFLAPLKESMFGGNAQEGRKIFYERAEVFCSRCHKMNGDGGEAGPDLTGIGTRKDRNYLIESIAFPNRQIAQGWENVLVTLQNGTSYAGRLKSEDNAYLEIDSPEDGEMKLSKNQIKSRERALSAMPEEFRHVLSKHDLRNLVEFLASGAK